MVEAKKVDKWKKKKWYQLQAPELLDRIPLGLTPAEKPELVQGRTVRVNARDLGNPTKRGYLDLEFKVQSVQGQNALTSLVGLEAKAGAMKRLIRRRSSKIETTQWVETKDGKKAKIKLLALGLNKLAASQETDIRNALSREIKGMASKKSLEQLLFDVVYGNVHGQLHQSVHKIGPVKKLEVLKVIEQR